MRTGTILSYNKIAAVGLLRDENNQTIKFYADGAKTVPARGENVSFEISFFNRGLVAINVTPYTRKSEHLIFKAESGGLKFLTDNI